MVRFATDVLEWAVAFALAGAIVRVARMIARR